MSYDKGFLVRQLVASSYRFDGYGKQKCTNSRDRPFFGNNTVVFGDYTLTTRLSNTQTLHLEFESVCQNGNIIFTPYELTFENYVSELMQAISDGSDCIAFQIEPVYEKCKSCNLQNRHCKYLQENQPKGVMAATSFDMQEVEQSLSVYLGSKKFPKNYNNKGENTMKNNQFGLNLEFGMCKDQSVKSTMLGVAFQNPKTKDWWTFDTATCTRKNIAGMKFGDFPIMLLPTKDLKVGDPIKKDGTYYYVKAFKPDGTIELINVADGMVHTSVPEENIILGKMSLYTKVVAFDINSLSDKSSNNPLGGNLMAAALMMQWADSDESTEFSLDSINDDSFNGLGAYMMMAMNGNNGLGGLFGGDTGGLAALMMLGNKKSGGNNDIVQMMVLSNLLGGGNNGISIPGFAGSAPAASNLDELVCTKCGAIFTNGEKFCTKCGGSVKPKDAVENIVACTKCGDTFSNGEKFCKKCGAPTRPNVFNCRGCNAKITADALFCPACGQKVQPDLCPHCGVEVKENDAFCSNCGGVQQKAEAETSAE